MRVATVAFTAVLSWTTATGNMAAAQGSQPSALMVRLYIQGDRGAQNWVWGYVAGWRNASTTVRTNLCIPRNKTIGDVSQVLIGHVGRMIERGEPNWATQIPEVTLVKAMTALYLCEPR